MLIDWITLRRKISDLEESEIIPLLPFLGVMKIFDPVTDEVLKVKLVANIEKVRSDFQGLVISLTSNGKDKFLNIGGSPASISGQGNNVFGNFDFHESKKIILDAAKKLLAGRLLQFDGWQPRRVDITENFLLESNFQVKEALNLLRLSDGSTRQKTTSEAKAGDTVYFGAGSRFRSGKAYDKFNQVCALIKKFQKQLKTNPFENLDISLLQGVLRLELSLLGQFFDQHSGEDFLTPEFLSTQHNDFFRQFLGNSEVTSMDKLFKNLIEISPTQGQAKAAYSTWLSIRQLGYHFVKETMVPRTFNHHKKLLIDAGLTLGDLKSAQIIPLRKRAINLQPVTSWEQLEEFVKRQKAA